MVDRAPPWASPAPAPQPADRGRLLGWKEVTAGLISGGLVSLLTVWVQAGLDDRREEQSNRQDEVRFVRQMAVDGKIEEASFYEADLRDANLSGLDLSGAEFPGADLRGANLTRTDLTGANLADAKLGNARLEGNDLRETDLTGVDFSGAHLEEVNLAGRSLKGSDMSGSTLTRVNLENAILEAVDLSDSTITDVQFNDSNLAGASLADAAFVADRDAFDRPVLVDLSKVQFFQTRARGADFSGALLPESIDTPVSWASAICYNRTTTWPAGYVPPQRKAQNCDWIQMSLDGQEPLVRFHKPLP